MRSPGTKGFTLVEVSFVLSLIAILIAISIFYNSGYQVKAFDAATKEDLRQAHSSALLYFLDYPQGNLTMNKLSKYGFKASPNVNTRIIDGGLTNLLIVSYDNTAGTQAYMVSYQGVSRSATRPQFWLEPIQGWGTGTNSSAVPPNSNPLENDLQENIRPLAADVLLACNRATISDLQEAHRAAQAYFQSNPEGALTKDILLAYGYNPNENINLTVIGGTASNLSMSAIFNIPRATNYVINNSGYITTGPANG